MLKKRNILTLLLWMLCSMLASAADTDLRNVKVGYYHIPGFHNLNSRGERSGYGYDFLQLVRRYQKMEFTYTGFDKSWEESLAMLQNGQIDLLTGALRTPERERMFDYSFPIGKTEINLYVLNRNVRYQPNVYRTYNGMRIGMVKSEMLDDRVYRMAQRNRFSCKVVSFDDFESMIKALDKGEIDAMCAIGTHRITGYRILESFDHECIYAIVKKGNSTLLNMINDAILQMDQSVVMWTLQLYQENYLTNESLQIEFSEKELDFIRRHSTPETAIKVATDDDWRPYSWYEQGKYHGIVVEILAELMKKAGLKYEFVEGKVSSEEVFKTHPEAELYIDFASTKQYAEEKNLVVSPAFMASSIAIVSLKGRTKMKKIGLSANTPMLNNNVKRAYDYTFVVFPSTDEVIEAVKGEKVDGAMLYDYVGQAYVNSTSEENLKINFIPDMMLPLHMVTRMEDERELITIISKCIDQLSESERDNIATKYITASEKELGAWDYIKKYPWVPLLILLLFFLVVMWEKYTRARILQRKDAQARKMAEEANNAKTSFLFNMSHDIRTPMNAIIGFRDLLEKNQDDPIKRADYLHKIEDASHVLLSIINNVLEMARIEKGTIELDETAWSAEQFIDSIYSVFIDMMEKKGLKFTQQLDVEHPYIYCDTIKLREVIINILSNAYKYTPSGSVDMKVEELPYDRNGWVLYRVTIADTGMGMSEDFLPHLFEEFSREHNTTAAKIEGTGLGMPIVKRLVSLMNGTIDVKSKKGEGTTFVITIPLRIADRSCLVEHTETMVTMDAFEGKRILLAEDNDLNAEIAMEILSEKGFDVEHAADGNICCDMLAAAPAHYYDLILMDIQMPEMNGYEATQCIRQMEDTEKANIPIIAMTANAFEEDKRNALRAGMNDHLAKPIDVHELIKTLAAIVSRK